MKKGILFKPKMKAFLCEFIQYGTLDIWCVYIPVKISTIAFFFVYCGANFDLNQGLFRVIITV